MLTENSAQPAVSHAQPAGSGSRRQHLLASVIILFLSASFFMIQYDRGRLLEAEFQSWYQAKASGASFAPDQYRIALPLLAHFLQMHMRMQMRQSIPLLESMSYGLGLVCLYLLLVRSSVFQAGSGIQRVAYTGMFFAAAQLPVLWIFPWERAETLPTMFYLAVVTFITVEQRIPPAPGCLLVTVLSLGQALNRSDAPVAAGLAMLIASATTPLSRPRRTLAIFGALCLATGAATQIYLKHLFPNAHTDPTVPVLQLFYNFSPTYPYAVYRVPTFLLGLLPLFFTLFLLRREHHQLDPADWLTLLIAIVYLPIYMTIGIIGEVRIYVPYLFLLTPLIAKVWVRFAVKTGAGALP